MQIEVPQWIKENGLTLTNFDQLRLTKNVYSVYSGFPAASSKHFFPDLG